MAGARTPRLRRLQRERGTIYIWAVFALVPLIGAAALAVDVGYMLVVRAQLQGASDASSVATLRDLQAGATLLDARRTAIDLARQSVVIGGGRRLEPSDIEVDIGGYNFSSGLFRRNSLAGAPSVRVRTHRALDLLLAPVVGATAADVAAEGVAAAGCRQIVLLQDVTASFSEADRAAAKLALRALVEAISDRSRPGDHVGIAIFAAGSVRFLPLRPLPVSQSGVEFFINAIPWCLEIGVDLPLPGLPSGFCLGTDHGDGLRTAIDMLDGQDSTCGAERLIVILSDGEPCSFLGFGGTESDSLQAADEAAALGISISSAMLLQASTPIGDCSADAAAAADFGMSLVRGFGRSSQTATADDLVPQLAAVAQTFPIRLVK